MWHEISQFDIPDRQLLATSSQSSVGRWTNIGEAKITHTIFGKAKVRIICEQDKIRRARLLAALAVAVIAVAAWQLWMVANQAEDNLPSASLSKVEVRPITTLQTETISPEANQKISLTVSRRIEPEHILDLKASEQKASKPVSAQPLMTDKQKAALDISNSEAKNQAETPQHLKQATAIEPAVPNVVTAPAEYSANKSASAVPVSEPLSRETASTSSSAGDNQAPALVNAQSK